MTAVFGNGTSPYWKVYANTGSEFSAIGAEWSVPEDDVGEMGFYTSTKAYDPSGYWSTMDISGDGAADLLVTAPVGAGAPEVFGNGSTPYWKVYLGTQ